MPLISVEVEVYCATCGKGICNLAEDSSRNGRLAITVEPCDSCLDAKYDEGHEEGYDQGAKDNEPAEA